MKKITLTTELIDLASYSDTLNKAQSELLGLSFPLSDNWQESLIDRELSVGDTNLLIMLRGNLALKAQQQIKSNYKLLTKFHNPKTQKIEKIQEPQELATAKSLEIYCDGGCQGNPGKSGSGLAIYGANKNQPTLIYGAFEAMGTNNTAELNALYKALLIAKEYERSIKITILSDSKYSIESITNWAYGWKKNNWKKKGGEIKNLDLIKKAHQLYEELKDTITIKHVKGHSGIEGNELADRMALLAITSQTQSYATHHYESIEEILL